MHQQLLPLALTSVTCVVVSWCLELCGVAVCLPFNQAVLETSPKVFQDPPGPSPGFIGGGQEVENHRSPCLQDGTREKETECSGVTGDAPGAATVWSQMTLEQSKKPRTAIWAVSVGVVSGMGILGEPKFYKKRI